MEEKAAAEEKAHRQKDVVQRKREEVRTAEGRLQDLSKSKGQHLSAFHHKISTLLRAIQSESRFREKPVGPVGNHVRLLRPEWSSVLERSFGASLNSFIVTSKQDQNLLSELMRRTQWWVFPSLAVDVRGLILQCESCVHRVQKADRHVKQRTRSFV